MKTFTRKALYFTLFFLLFSLVLNSIFLGLIATTDWDFIKRRESLNWENPDFELLVLGNSLSEYGIDTELLTSEGIKSFNLALVGSSIKTSYVQLEEYLGKYSQKPRYVVLAINSHLERFDQEGIQPVVEFTMKGHKYNLKDVPISKFNWAGMELLKKAIRPTYRKLEVSCGQKKSNALVPDHSSYHELYLDKDKYENAKWIGELSTLCSENDIELILVEIPGVNETQNLSDLGPYTLQFAAGPTADLYNFNTQEFCTILDVEKDWGGLSHFNKHGAAKFTKELLRVTSLGD
jgi:hypothetical protein